MSNLTTKQCTKCGQEYPLNEQFWHRDKKSKDGYRTHCKQCVLEANRLSNYNKNKPKQLPLFDEKQCYLCKEIFPRTDDHWYKDSHTKDGYQTRCKQCNYELTRRWQKRNPDRVNSSNSEWARNNREKIAEKSRRWNSNNREKRKSYENKRRAKKAGSNGSHTGDQIKTLYKQQNRQCFHCDVNLDITGYHEDHWIPLSRGGSNRIENIRLLCPKCNLNKGNKLPQEWNDRYK